MTYGELNVVRNLKKLISDEEKKLAALQLCVEEITSKGAKFARDKDGSYPYLDTMPKGRGAVSSRPENFAVMIADAEAKIRRIQARMDQESFNLTDKIQREVPSDFDRTLLIYRYVACKHFREIGILLGVSEAHTYFKHREILKTLLQENLIADNSQ